MIRGAFNHPGMVGHIYGERAKGGRTTSHAQHYQHPNQDPELVALMLSYTSQIEAFRKGGSR